jgi:DHA2 family multidrug resistance protein-like MFS transporter
VSPRLLALLLGVLVSTVNESALAPALPFLARDLGISAGEAQGVVTAGLLGAALAYLPLTFTQVATYPLGQKK